MFPPATPGSTLNEHPDAGIAYIRVSSCLYKQFIHLFRIFRKFLQGTMRIQRRDIFI